MPQKTEFKPKCAGKNIVSLQQNEATALNPQLKQAFKPEPITFKAFINCFCL